MHRAAQGAPNKIPLGRSTAGSFKPLCAVGLPGSTWPRVPGEKPHLDAACTGTASTLRGSAEIGGLLRDLEGTAF